MAKDLTLALDSAVILLATEDLALPGASRSKQWFSSPIMR